MDTIKKNEGFLTGAHLKWIAMVSMFIDHATAILLPPMFMQGEGALLWNFSVDKLYELGRGIGRLAFPIYCFLLVEGYFHTSDQKKFLRNLVLFALISEIPFNLAFNGKAFDPSYQNVFVTLTLGYLGLYFLYGGGLHIFVRLLGIFGLAYLSLLCRADYDLFGYAAIMIFGLVYPHPKIWRIPATCFAFYFEGIPAMLAGLPIYFYNGKRGNLGISKYFFYWFYPAHLAVLTLIRYWIFGPGLPYI